MSSTPKITTLDQLTNVNDELYAEVFESNINVIFQYSEKDISSVLESKELEVVLNTRNNLCDKVKQSFPEFANRRFINRKVKHLAIQDIISMANSILRDGAVREMEKVFVTKSPAEVEADSDLISIDFDANDPASVATEIRLLASEINRLRSQYDSSLAQHQCQCNCLAVSSERSVPQAVACSSNTEDIPSAAISNNNNHSVIDVTTKSNESSASGSSDEEGDGPSFQVSQKNRKKRKPTVKSVSPASQMSYDGTKRDMYLGNVNSKCNVYKIRQHIQRHGYNILDKDIALLHKGSDYTSFRVSVPSAKYDMISKIWSKGIKVRPFSPSKGPRGNPQVRRGSTNTNNSRDTARRYSGSQNFAHNFKAGYDQAMQDARHLYSSYRPSVSPSAPRTSQQMYDYYPFADGKYNFHQWNSSPSDYDIEFPRLPSMW